MANKHKDVLSNKGITIVIVILAMLILGMLGVVLASLQSVDFESAKQQLQSARAFYLADAGTQHAFKRLSAGNISNVNGTYYLGQGRYQVLYSGSATAGNLTVDGYVPALGTPDARRTISVTIDQGGQFPWSSFGLGNFDWNGLKSGSEVNGDVCASGNISPNPNVPQCSGCTYLREQHVIGLIPPIINMNCFGNFVWERWPSNYVWGAKTFTSSPPANQVWYIWGNVTINASSADIIFNHVTIITWGNVQIQGNYKVEMTAYVDPAHTEYTYPCIAALGNINSAAPSSGTDLQKRLKRVFDSMLYTMGNIEVNYFTGESLTAWGNTAVRGLCLLNHKAKRLPCFLGGVGCGSGGDVGGPGINTWREQ